VSLAIHTADASSLVGCSIRASRASLRKPPRSIHNPLIAGGFDSGGGPGPAIEKVATTLHDHLQSGLHRSRSLSGEPTFAAPSKDVWRSTTLSRVGKTLNLGANRAPHRIVAPAVFEEPTCAATRLLARSED